MTSTADDWSSSSFVFHKIKRTLFYVIHQKSKGLKQDLSEDSHYHGLWTATSSNQSFCWMSLASRTSIFSSCHQSALHRIQFCLYSSPATPFQFYLTHRRFSTSWFSTHCFLSKHLPLPHPFSSHFFFLWMSDSVFPFIYNYFKLFTKYTFHLSWLPSLTLTILSSLPDVELDKNQSSHAIQFPELCLFFVCFTVR